MDSYNAMPGVRWSVLREILTSPRHYLHREQNPREDTGPLAFGRAAHCAVLTPVQYAEDGRIVPPEHLTPAGGLSTKAATREWIASLGPEPMLLTSADVDAIGGILRNLDIHDDAREWLDRADVREHALTWTETVDGVDVLCKCKVDAYCPKLRLLWDLKTMGGRRPFTVRAVQGEIVARSYLGQLGFYARGLRANGMDVDSIGWLFVESRPPFDVCAVEADADLLTCADEEADRAIVAYAHALGSGNWHGVAPSRVIMRPPAWMLADEGNTADEELEFDEAEASA